MARLSGTTPLHNTDGTLNATAIRFFQKCGETIR